MKVQTILLENNEDRKFYEGIIEGILASYNIYSYATDMYTSKYIYYQFICNETTKDEILTILTKKFIKYKIAKTKIELN